MLSKAKSCIVLVMSLFFAAPQASLAVPVVVYSNNFESGAGSIGPEWSGATWHAAHSISEVTAHVGDYFLSGGTTLTLAGLPAHSTLSLQFDLYLFNTWDGENLTFGNDFFSLRGDVVFSASFTNHQPEGQSYPGAADVNPGRPGSAVTQIYLGLDPLGTGDAFFINHTASTFSVTFGGPTSQTDEQWGIDNIRVTVDTPGQPVPEPATLALLCMGFLGLYMQMARRRRRSGQHGTHVKALHPDRFC